MNDIKIGSKVELLYWQDKQVHTFEIVDIYFEAYISGYKTVVKAKYYSERSECWFVETYYINDFFKFMEQAKVANSAK